ncbi:MAG TPA: TolC family protein [Gemmatimonadaceae bacterium]|nr:TolC family protein [Gemmatimonadaceae bacterium]
MRFLLCSLAVCLTAAPLAAQTPAPTSVGPVLSLNEALDIARRNNPTYLQTVEGRRRASAAVRSAYGDLLPNINSSFSTQFRQGRPQLINGVAFGASGDQISSGYSISANLNLSGASILAPKAQRASATATEAEIAASAATLRMDVTQQYLAVLQQQARARLQDTLVATTQAQLELARIRQSVGSATPLEVQQAEVALGQQQVAALQAQNQAEVEKLRLFQMMGVTQPEGVQLTTEFPIEQPQLSLDQLLQLARSQNPTLTALRARRRASDIGVAQARSEYFPSLSVSTGIGGYTSQFTDDDFLIGQRLGNLRGGCESENSLRELVGLPPTVPDCSALTLSPEQISEIRAGNRAFPFDFTQNPWSIQASLSLPIFNGFSREQRLQEAQVQRNEAQYRARAQELQLTADVTGAYLTLMSDFQAVQLQEQNARTARQALLLAQERYRVGASNFVELSQARDTYTRAEVDRINAIYEFHRAYAALEGAVGRPLR